MPVHAQLERVSQREPPYNFYTKPAIPKFEQFAKPPEIASIKPKVITIPLLPTQDDLPSCDGVPMETERHKKQMDLLIYSLEPWLGKRGYVGGNMFVYFSLQQVKNKDFRGPDVFVTLGVSNKERKSWVVWEKGKKSPDIVIELLSESTAQEDKKRKKDIYQNQLKVSEYFWFDPHNPNDWKGFKLSKGVYKELPLKNGGLTSKSLGLKLIHWRGVYKNVDTVWLRWATFAGDLLLLPEEAEAQRAEAEAQRANAAEQRAITAFDDGKQKERFETARKMLTDGLDSAIIMKYTGLSAAELATLSK